MKLAAELGLEVAEASYQPDTRPYPVRRYDRTADTQGNLQRLHQLDFFQLAAFGAGERLSRSAWLGVLLGFLGVTVVLRPGGDTFIPATLLPVLAALFYAQAMLVTRHHCQNEHPLLLTLGLNLAFLAAGSLFSALVEFNGTTALSERAPFLFGNWRNVIDRGHLRAAVDCREYRGGQGLSNCPFGVGRHL